MSFKSLALLLAFAAPLALAQGTDLPSTAPAADPSDTSLEVLSSKRFPWPNVPEHADTCTLPACGPRGSQFGFNVCNSTTQNQQSNCQTAFINSIEDFCIWSSPTVDIIADTEAREVAWCTKPTHGTRLIPEGALTGVQFLTAPSYVMVTGFIDQTLVNLPPTDYGGELDPHGADNRGNPLGGLVYSSGFGGTNGAITQSIEWSLFIGGGIFCFKACTPTAPDARRVCNHIYDRIGCNYNAPAAYVNGTFESCLSDDMAPVGVYVSDGQVVTYKQPAESLGVITTVPYVPVIPASSSCTTFQSAQLYANLPSVSVSIAPTTTSTTTVTTTVAGGVGDGLGGGSTGSAGGSEPTSTDSSSGASASSFGSASSLLVAAAAVLVGIAFIA